jgi:hypothetical protein
MAGYYGKTQRPNLEDAIAQAVEAERRTIWTNLPGRVVSVSADGRTATIKPLHKPVFNGKAVEMPDLVGVPLERLRAGGFIMSMPVKPGDEGMISVMSRNMDEWYGRGGEQAGFTARAHDLSDATFKPGLSFSGADFPDYNPDSLEIRSVDGTTKIEFTADGKIALESAGEELVGILDEFMAVMESHTNEGLEHDQAGAVAGLRARLNALKRS